jgi:hypothetical protein
VFKEGQLNAAMISRAGRHAAAGACWVALLGKVVS